MQLAATTSSAELRTLSLVWRTDAYRSAAARAFTEFAAARTWPSDA